MLKKSLEIYQKKTQHKTLFLKTIINSENLNFN